MIDLLYSIRLCIKWYKSRNNNNFFVGVPGVISTPNSGLDPGSQPPDPQMLSSFSSSSSSGTSSLLGTLTDTFAKSVHELNDIDLDTSLADLSAFQVSIYQFIFCF